MSNICKCDRPYEVWEATVEQPYHYTESGLQHVFLAGVTVHSCPNCGVLSADIPQLDGLHDLITRDIILKPLPMTGDEFRFLRKEVHLKYKELAERLGIDPKTLKNWEGLPKLSRQADVSVRVLVALEMWRGDEVMQVIKQLADLFKYGWEDPDEIEQDIERLAAENTVLGLNANQEWAMA